MSDELSPAPRQRMIALMLALFLGPLGAHRFYLGYTGIGVAQLLTFGGCGVWFVVDVIVIALGKMRDSAGRELA